MRGLPNRDPSARKLRRNVTSSPSAGGCQHAAIRDAISPGRFSAEARAAWAGSDRQSATPRIEARPARMLLSVLGHLHGDDLVRIGHGTVVGLRALFDL